MQERSSITHEHTHYPLAFTIRNFCQAEGYTICDNHLNSFDTKHDYTLESRHRVPITPSTTRIALTTPTRRKEKFLFFTIRRVVLHYVGEINIHSYGEERKTIIDVSIFCEKKQSRLEHLATQLRATTGIETRVFIEGSCKSFLP